MGHKRFKGGILALLLISVSLNPAQGFASESALQPLDRSPRICILNYLRETHPFSHAIDQVFEDARDVRVIHDALPVSFLQCVKGGAEEIVIIGHTFGMNPGDGNLEYKLGYYSRLEGNERHDWLDVRIQAMRKRLGELDARPQPRRQKAGPQSVASMEFNREAAMIRRRLKRLESLPKDYPLYEPKPFLNNIFLKTREWAAELRATNQSIPLKSLRFLGCLQDEVMRSHPDLKLFVEENGIALDSAPNQFLMSALSGHPVTTLDRRWLSISAQDEEKENGFFVYLNIKTLVVPRWGEATALRGKYRVKTRGIGLGLSSKYTTLFIKSSEVEGMQAGEKRTLKIPQLEMAAALWLNGELQVGRKTRFLIPREINSIGAHLGFFHSIEIERLY